MKELRKMALILLDEPNGMDAEAYGHLKAILDDAGEEGIDLQVTIANDRAFFANEDFAEEELARVGAELAELDKLEVRWPDALSEEVIEEVLREEYDKPDEVTEETEETEETDD